ncbi:hypothetical protein Tsubulata_041730 [Turnera subulata]|uniref:C2 domain-containing protein n=1 Tax=Turnera subulata TaxID=218843 RepID=A0A9Q0J8Y0_9ROSI|nr:hypothetical protein Tsubulata_041730 [Turnera subulata]
MSISGIQGLPLEVTVVCCSNLDDKEWISRQDPYVSVEYGHTKHRTKTCTDGGRNPSFQQKFCFTLIEGLNDLNIVVWNYHTLAADEHIGTARIQLYKVLSQGYDDSFWPLQSKTGRHSGDVRVILHYAYANTTMQKQKLAPMHATPPGALSSVLPYTPAAPAAYHHPTTTPHYPAARGMGRIRGMGSSGIRRGGGRPIGGNSPSGVYPPAPAPAPSGIYPPPPASGIYPPPPPY